MQPKKKKKTNRAREDVMYKVYCEYKNWVIKVHALYNIHYRDKYSDREMPYVINSTVLILLVFSMFPLRSFSHPSLALTTLQTLSPRLLAIWLAFSFK